jgi:hypothetical protein
METDGILSYYVENSHINVDNAMDQNVLSVLMQEIKKRKIIITNVNVFNNNKKSPIIDNCVPSEAYIAKELNNVIFTHYEYQS